MNTKQVIKTVKETAAIDYRMAEIFQNIDLDFCDGHNKTIKYFCHKVNEPGEQLKPILEPSNKIKRFELHEYHTWDIDSLINYIIINHHQYEKDNAVVIYELAQKVANRHCGNHPEFSKLTAEIFFFFHDLLNQMAEEEEIYFPGIKQLTTNGRISGNAINTTFGLLKDMTTLMRKEHKVTIRYLKRLRKITNNYKSPEDACNSCYYLFEKMKEFETDLLLHVHLESNVLFPKAIAMVETPV